MMQFEKNYYSPRKIRHLDLYSEALMTIGLIAQKKKRKIEILRDSFTCKDDVLWYKGKTCVPLKAIVDITELAHNKTTAGHFSFVKTLGRLHQYHWKHKYRDVRHYCEGCQHCQQQKDHHGSTLNGPAALEIPKRR